MSYNYEEMSVNEARDLLRQWRENNERRSDDIMDLWTSMLQYNFNKLGNEMYIVLEQVMYAALDCHCYSVADLCSVTIAQDFPRSIRMFKYRVAYLSATEKYDEALEMLDKLIKTDETNAALRKMRVSIYKALGQTTEAIKELVDYLKKFMSDVEAWQELSELYLQVQEYQRAAFCAEELILHQPHNHLMHQRLADIRYTMGGVENMELAKSYYCQALNLNPDNMRALLGLFLVTNNLMNHYKSSGNSSKRKEVWKLCQWAQTKASRKQRAPQTPPLANMMLALAITD